MLRTFGRRRRSCAPWPATSRSSSTRRCRRPSSTMSRSRSTNCAASTRASEIKKQLNPFEKAAADVRAGLDGAEADSRPPVLEPAAPAPQPAEPLKNGGRRCLAGAAGPRRCRRRSPRHGAGRAAARRSRRPAAQRCRWPLPAEPAALRAAGQRSGGRPAEGARRPPPRRPSRSQSLADRSQGDRRGSAATRRPKATRSGAGRGCRKADKRRASRKTEPAA